MSFSIPVEISVPAQLRIAENHTTVHVCASLSVDPATAVTNRAINISLGTINGTGA